MNNKLVLVLMLQSIFLVAMQSEHEAETIMHVRDATIEKLKQESDYIVPYYNTDSYFDNHHNIHVIAGVPDEKCIHAISCAPYKTVSEHCCVVEIETVNSQKQELSLGLLYRFPVLFKKIVNEGYSVQFNEKLCTLTAFACQYKEDCIFPFDVIHKIISTYREVAGDQVQLVYGSLLQQQEKKAALLLGNSIQNVLDCGPINCSEWDDADIWQAIKHATLWKETHFNIKKSVLPGGTHVKKKLWDYIFKKHYDNDETIIYYVAGNDQLTVREGNELICVRQWFDAHTYREVLLRHSLLEHTPTMLKSDTYQDFVHACAINSVARPSDDCIVVTLNDGQQLTAKKEGDYWYNRSSS